MSSQFGKSERDILKILSLPPPPNHSGSSINNIVWTSLQITYVEKHLDHSSLVFKDTGENSEIICKKNVESIKKKFEFYGNQD